MTKTRQVGLFALAASCLAFCALFLVLTYIAVRRAVDADRATLVGAVIGAAVCLLLAVTFAVVSVPAAARLGRGRDREFHLHVAIKVLMAICGLAVATAGVLAAGGFVEGIIP